MTVSSEVKDKIIAVLEEYLTVEIPKRFSIQKTKTFNKQLNEITSMRIEKVIELANKVGATHIDIDNESLKVHLVRRTEVKLTKKEIDEKVKYYLTVTGQCQ